MTTRTKAQVTTQALEQAGLIGTGETQTSAMTTDFGLLYDQLYEEMDARQMVQFASAAMPSKYISTFAAMMAVRGAQTWDIPDNNYLRAALIAGADCKKGMDTIKEIDAKAWSHSTIPADFM
ncbi:MAG: hypothetical protein HOB79_17600 [Rhodospirillaceae bacterium]|nr:hypothetical protein [Rhodospirillaceae bacterium]